MSNCGSTSARWPDWDPRRLERDLREVSAFAPELEFLPVGSTHAPNCGWFGPIPLWPFDRTRPEGLDTLVDSPLSVLVVCSSAHPVVAPTLYPIDPEPQLQEVSDTVWHVAPGQSLCLFQSDGFWDPAASITELLTKAAGWRIEYALMHANAIERMTERGIVSDPSFDAVITAAAQTVSGALTSKRV
ncbi:hypothetical protein [Plantibacter sp. ME-Dv--P-095]|uniref:hypothetical protein n=1 Tax=Plantibacter sp. ME-Dv--P-095 TaxID=3040299 RepID=UPI00254CF125|nr:hypothetical protein [Plantibacter sp. ME-Dv--P-095]